MLEGCPVGLFIVEEREMTAGFDVAEIVAFAAEARDRYLSFRVEERDAQLRLLRHARHYAEALQCAKALHLGYKRLARRGVEDPVEGVFML